MMIRQILSIAAILMILGGVAQAQVSGVVMGGDHGKVFALEADTGGLVLRGGLIGRAGVNDVAGLDYAQVMALDRGHEWDVTAGLAWRFRGDMPVSMDLGLDFEPMAPGVRADGIDVRGRIGGALHVSERAALFVERSRSLHNGTNYGRWMLGGRVGF